MTEVPTRPGATTMVLRDGTDGLEVVLQRRSPHLVFVPGAHAFPGGRVEAADGLPHPVTGPVLTDAAASERLGVDAGGLAYWVAAVRELYEEVGLLVADGPVDRLGPHRAAVDRGEQGFAALCAEHGVTLRPSDLRYFGHWTTPPGAPRRYSTRFFVAPAPEGQEPLHDGNEAVEAGWVRPRDALERFAAGDWELILPTERSLLALTHFDRVDDVLAHLDTQPPLTDDHGGRRIALPSELAGVHQETL